MTKVKISNLSVFFTFTPLSPFFSFLCDQMTNNLPNMSTYGITLVKKYLAFNPKGHKQVEIQDFIEKEEFSRVNLEVRGEKG